MSYKLRKSESTRSPLLVEYTQGGILMRFNIQEVMRMDIEYPSVIFTYDEFWFDINEPDIEVIVADNGFLLTAEYKEELI
jgi:hypothetical protein